MTGAISPVFLLTSTSLSVSFPFEFSTAQVEQELLLVRNQRIAETILRSYVDGGRSKAVADQPLTDRQREGLRFLAREAASALAAPPAPPLLSPAFFKILAIALTIAISAYFAWSYYRSSIEQKFPVVDTVLEHAGLKSQDATSDEGNPDAKVWIDLHTGLVTRVADHDVGDHVLGAAVGLDREVPREVRRHTTNSLVERQVRAPRDAALEAVFARREVDFVYGRGKPGLARKRVGHDERKLLGKGDGRGAL